MGGSDQRRPRERLVRRTIGSQSRRLSIAAPSPPALPGFLRTPYLKVFFFFGAIIALGTFLLLLPWATADGTTAAPITAFFTASSATFVTGLILVDTGEYWSFYGHLVILGLIEAGGLGYVAGLALIFFGRDHRASLADRQSLRITFGGGSLGSVSKEAKEVVLISIGLQVAGFVLLAPGFFVAGLDVPEAIWNGIFHSVSGFHNAGFDVTGGAPSLFEYRNSLMVTGPITVLSFIGATGAVAVLIVSRRHRWGTLPLDMKLVLAGMFGVAFAGFIGVMITEWTNPATLGNEPVLNRIWDSFVMAAGNRTSGFSTFSVTDARHHTHFLLIWLMLIGGAAGSMTGGIKINVFMVMVVSVLTSIRGMARTAVFGREIADAQVRRAMAIAAFAFAWVNGVALLLSLIEDEEFVHILFDVVSAFGLVGLSTGAIDGMSDFSHIVIIVCMFVGRFAPFFIALELLQRERQVVFRYPDEEVRIG